MRTSIKPWVNKVIVSNVKKYLETSVSLEERGSTVGWHINQINCRRFSETTKFLASHSRLSLLQISSDYIQRMMKIRQRFF